MPDPLAKLIAFYLPQYHPIPENDAWWGKGFTEWTNVVNARPLFRGHYQPHLPADLGFYDLRLPETRQAQADLAREYGIFGFCYYHYWFNGRRILNRPFDEVLQTGEPDFPFCLCWANENWSRRWDGMDKQLLLEQHYSAEDDLQHIRWLASAFRDPRYIRVDGKPLFLVYRASQLPNPSQTTTLWREEARRLGIDELYLCKVEGFWNEHDDPRLMGFDAAVEFQPDVTRLGTLKRVGRISRRLDRFLTRGIGAAHRADQVYDYALTVERMLKPRSIPYKIYSCVTPSWDNTARRKNKATILKGATPELYERWLAEVVARSARSDLDDRIVFLNAWNEWAEGSHLEPCQKWGRAYLEATRRSVLGETHYGIWPSPKGIPNDDAIRLRSLSSH